jgi:hypothetical protein
MGVVLANPDLENCFREGQIAAWVSGGYPTGEDKDSFMREECFHCASDHCELSEDVGLYIEEERAVCVGLGWYVFASTNPAQWVRAKFGAVVGVNIWRKDGGCGVSNELFCGRYFDAIVDNAEDEPGAWAMMKAKVVVLLGR